MDFDEFRRRCEGRQLIGVFNDVCRRHRIRLEDVYGRVRTKNVVQARRECWAATRRLGWSFPEIGHLWDRDHTTILTSLRVYEGTCDPVPAKVDDRADALERRVAKLEEQLRAIKLAIR